MNFVIDTNVLVSALYRSQSTPYNMVLFAFNNKHNFVYYTNDIFLEYEDVLNRTKFNFDKEEIKRLLYQIKQKGMLVKNVNYHFNDKMVDDDDRMFYELAKCYDCLLITGNIKHYPNDPIVISPKEFMDKLSHLA